MDDAFLVVDAVSRVVDTPNGPRNVLAATSFELRPGEYVALAGPSGSGKTSLCNVLAGWEAPDTGTVTWTTPSRSGWERLAVVPQRLALIAHLTVIENISLPAWSDGVELDPTSTNELATSLAIDELLDRLPRELSFGEQQRAAIARALAYRPTLALLDEPTGHQDEARTMLVVDALRRACDSGTCALVATHDPTVIRAADRVIELRPVLGTAERPSGRP